MGLVLAAACVKVKSPENEAPSEDFGECDRIHNPELSQVREAQ